MKYAYEVLKQKEADLARVRHEIESLRIVAPLLLDLNSGKTNLSDDLLNIVRKTGTDSEPTGAAGHVFSSILKRFQ